MTEQNLVPGNEAEPSLETIKAELVWFHRKGIFQQLRSEEQDERTFFNPNMGYITENDESPVGTVLDLYRTALIEKDPIAIRNYCTDEEIQEMIDSLEPGSFKRQLLLAYYGIPEGLKWHNDAKQRISEKQRSKYADNFPSPNEVSETLANYQTLQRYKTNPPEKYEILTGKIDAKPTIEITYDSVKDLLTDLNELGIFYKFRSMISRGRGFFDPTNGYIEENDESPTTSVLSMYRDLLIGEDPLVMGDFKQLGAEAQELESRIRQKIIDVLDPKNADLLIFLAFYNLTEDIPWNVAQNHISEAQTFKEEDFPRDRDILRILDNLEKTKTEE